MMHMNPFSRFIKFLMSILGLGFLAGSLLALRTDDDMEKDPRKELARRLRSMADRIETADDTGSTDTQSDQ